MTKKLTIGGLRRDLFFISSFQTFLHYNIIISYTCNIFFTTVITYSQKQPLEVFCNKRFS